jgi:hypothetical protein
VLDEALLIVWGSGARATAAVVNAPRGEVAPAIVQHAVAWRADVIVLTRRRRRRSDHCQLPAFHDAFTAAFPALSKLNRGQRP